MTRDAKRASGRWVLFLAAAVLAACGAEEAEGSGPPALESSALRAAAPRASGGALRWVDTVRSAGGSDAPVAVARDARGNVITLGNHLTPVDLGQGPQGSSPGSSVLAVSKYSPEGALLWVRLLEVTAPGGAYVRGQALAVEKHGTLLLTGMQSGGLRLGGAVLPPGAFLARLDEDGHPLWARPLPTLATALAADARGHITLAGVLSGRVDFGTGPVTGAGNPYLVQLDSEGAPRWVLVDSARGVPGDLALDDSGALYLSGGHFLPPSPLLTPFLTRVSSEGEHQWTRQLAGASGLGMSVAAHGGDVVVSGSFTGRFTFRGEPFAATTSRGFALAYGREGDERWGSLLGSTWGLVAVDEGSGVVVAGRYMGGQDFGLGLGTLGGYPGATNLYVLRLQRPTGRLQWIHTYPSASTLPVSLAVTRQGASALTGTFRAPVDFGTGPLSPGPGSNAFVLQLER